MGCDMSVPVEKFENQTGINLTGPGAPTSKGRVALDYVHPDPVSRWKATLSANALHHKKEKQMTREQLGKFKDMQKRRVLAEVIEAFKNPTGEPFVLVLDELGAKILNTQIDMTNIMYPEGPVAMVEKLSVVRQPMPDMEAVYFVRPSLASVKYILGDFAKQDSTGKLRADWGKGDELYVEGQLGARSPDAQYKGVHLLFCDELNPVGEKMLMNCPELKRHLLSFTETRLGIFPMESNFINFSLGNSLSTLYGHDKTAQGIMDRKTNQLYEDIANKLLGVCVTLHELPVVRYFNNNPRSKPVVDKFCKKIFEHFEKSCVTVKNGDVTVNDGDEETWWYHRSEMKDSESSIPDRAQLLIFDRAEDLSTPLHHEFTYQAMAMDLLSEDITEDEAQVDFEYRYSQALVNGGSVQKIMKLNDDDDVLWRAGKHKHLVDLATFVTNWGKRFHESEEWQLIQKQKQGALTRPKDQMRLLRTSEQSIKKEEALKQHTALALKLFKLKDICIDGEPLLFEINEIETQIARGHDCKKKSVSDDKVRSNLMRLLSRPEVEWNDKKRLLMMWFIHFGWKYSKEKHDKVIDSCEPRLKSVDKATINHLRYLNIPLHDYKYEKAEKRKLQLLRNEKQNRSKEKEQTSEATIEIEPDLVSIVSRHISMTLDKAEYPWKDPLVKEPTQELIDAGFEGPINEPIWYTNKNNGTNDKKKGKSMRKPTHGLGGNGHLRGKSGLGVKKSKAFGTDLGLKGNSSTNGEATVNNEDTIDVHDSLFEFKGTRIIVCVFGGITYAELKGLYDLMRKTKKEIIVCATDILTSKKFINILGSMGGDDGYGHDDSDDENNSGGKSGDTNNTNSGIEDINLDFDGV